MLIKIKKALVTTRKWLAERCAGLVTAVKKIPVPRQTLSKVGYYAALALLLVLLGTASYAWRVRRRAAADAPAEPRREAIAVHTPFPAFLPEATPVPVQWVWPLEGEIIGAYSPDAPVWSKTLEQWQTHPALDLQGSPGEAVYACRDGRVVDAWSDRLWGNTVVIEHDSGYRSTYAGLNTLQMVHEGDDVQAGQVIGSVGQSAACEAERGWHLHFELTRNGKPVDFAQLTEGEE